MHNLRRSKSMCVFCLHSLFFFVSNALVRWETTALNVSYETPMEVIEQLRTKIISYVASNNREWSDCALNIDKMEYQNAIYLNVSMERKYPRMSKAIHSLNLRTRSTKLAGLGRKMDETN